MSDYSKDRLAGVVIAPHVSEKAARVANEGNQYVFRVRRDATKPEIRAAVEYMFEVKVDAVKRAHTPERLRRRPRRHATVVDLTRSGSAICTITTVRGPGG